MRTMSLELLDSFIKCGECYSSSKAENTIGHLSSTEKTVTRILQMQLQRLTRL